MAAGLIAIWNDIEPAGRADFLAWHSREHIPERVSIAGFIRGRRAYGIAARPQYLTLYDVAGPDVLTSAAYLDRLNAPTPWTKRSVANFRNTERAACSVIEQRGTGSGGRIVSVRAWSREAEAPFVAAARRFDAACRITVGAADHAGTGVQTSERAIRQGDAVPPELVVVIETFDGTATDLVPAVTQAFAAGALPIRVDAYDLEFSLGAEP